ncbi:MAG: rhodanese-like domain-containing protein [Ignavibacteriales bacterium]|nr:MAG: rhodanese-like domain-containing protein [Ignavibacteriales bacterium]
MTDNSYIDLDSKSFSDLLKNKKDAVLVDVRTQMEYNMGHIPGSLLIDISRPTFFDEIAKLDKDKEYLLYCRSGSRSYHAGQQMVMLGFKKVYNLESGLIDWDEPLEK